jgi:hypothetical protein
MRLINKLPESVAELADVIGREDALALIGRRQRSGRRSWRICFYIPKHLPLDHWLVGELGLAKARRLSREFASMILQPSNCRFLIRPLRDARIIELAALGVSEADIGASIGLSQARVYEIRSAGKPARIAKVTA